MTSLEEIEETLAEIQALPTYKTPQQAPVQRSGFVQRISARLTDLRRSHHSGGPRYYAIPEKPLDAVARKYPYMYADALLG